MAKTPRAMLDALELITTASLEQVRSLGPVREAQILKLRRILTDPNVVGVGISEKVTGDETTGELSVCFYVKKKRAPEKLRGNAMVPPLVFSSRDQALFTDVKEIGAFRLHATAVARPVQSGLSVSHAADPAGTLGAIVRRANRLFILSSSHVLARCGLAAIGDPVISPGRTDGGQLPGDHVALLSAFVPLSSTGINAVDAAIAEILPGRLADVQLQIPQVKLPTRVRAAERGMQVTKFGKSTKTTTATVIDPNFFMALRYPHNLGTLQFANQILCTPFANNGDSGAIVVDMATGQVVGIHFAGTSEASAVNPIGPAMSALGFVFGV